MWHEAKTLSYICIRGAQGSRSIPRSDADLIYSPQQLTSTKRPWVVDFEYANALVDYGDIRLARRFVHRHLSSEHCRKILPWSDWAKRTLYRSLDCRPFQDKIETLHFAVEPKSFAKKGDDDALRLLFVGSVNQFNYLNFEWKGGYEAIDAFVELSRKYDDLELIIRSWAPDDAIGKCTKTPGIRLLNSTLSGKELAEIYRSADIFLFPSYLNLGMVVLEAMSFGLPVVAPRIYDVPEAVEDMRTGVLLDTPPGLPLYIWNGAPNHLDPNLLPQIRRYRPRYVKEVVEKTSPLIEDGSLRARMGREARSLVERGKFSIKQRNEKLKRIFDESL